MTNNRYDIILADTEESKTIHYNLRYQVYCLEKGFEEAQKFKDQLETDEYDRNSIHFLIRCNKSNQWIGTFRLVIDTLDQLPISQHARVESTHFNNGSKLVAEFSRLAVLRQYQQPTANREEDDDEAESGVIFRVMSAGIEYCRRHDIHHAVFICRRSLAYVLDKKGVTISKIGPKIVYRGVRHPYRFNLSDFPSKVFTNEMTSWNYHRNKLYFHHSQSIGKIHKAA